MPFTEGLISRLRYSTRLVVVIVFFSLLTDSMLLTIVDPILPDMLRRIDNVTLSATDMASEVINSNGRYGYLVSAKGAAQFVCNPFVGLFVTRFGYRKPMLIGGLVLLTSTVAFAYGDTYWFLLVTRTFQGVSSSITAVTGMGLLAATYTDDTQRGRVMGVAIGGLSFGIILGPVYGSIVYQLWGQAVPFLALAAIILFEISLQIFGFISENDLSKKDHSMSSVLRVMTDPYILIVAGNVFLLNLNVACILGFLPIRLLDLEEAPTWKLGIVVLPTSIGYLVATIIFPRTTKWLKRWLAGFIGLWLSAITLVALAFSHTFMHMLIVTTFLGLALGMVSTSMQPIFAFLVDLRHTSLYGNVYAISDMSVCLAMFVGPLVGGQIVFYFGFESLVIGSAVLDVSFSIFCFLLRNPPAIRAHISPDFMDISDEKTQLLSKSPRNSVASTISRQSQRSEKRKSVVEDLEKYPVPRPMHFLSSMDSATYDKDSTDHMFSNSV